MKPQIRWLKQLTFNLHSCALTSTVVEPGGRSSWYWQDSVLLRAGPDGLPSFWLFGGNLPCSLAYRSVTLTSYVTTDLLLTWHSPCVFLLQMSPFFRRAQVVLDKKPWGSLILVITEGFWVQVLETYRMGGVVKRFWCRTLVEEGVISPGSWRKPPCIKQTT